MIFLPLSSPALRRLFPILFFCLVAGIAGGGEAFGQEKFSTGRLAILSGGGTHEFKVELAITKPQRAQGLMWRRNLAPDRGMLFVYSRERILRMWMKNTLIPLDMLFIDRQGVIVGIHERAVPLSLRTIGSGRRARAVLELAGGTAARLGLKPGDKVLSPALGTR